MDCKHIEDLFHDYLNGRLDPAVRKTVDSHLATCETCRLALEQMGLVWQTLGELPDEEPSPALRSRFYAMLEAQKRGVQEAREKVPWRERLEAWLGLWWPQRPAVQFALSAALLIVGLFVGSQIQGGGQVGQLREEIQDMRQMFTLSLLNQSSSSERLRGVSWSTRVDRPDESLLSALLNTLNADPNVNVRLGAVDALMLFSSRPGVRAALIESLSRQTSPLVQVAIIDLLVQIREKRSLEALRNLIQDEHVDPSVREYAQESIQELT